MLTDISVPKPIHVVFGPEIFYQKNAMGLNMNRVKAFQRVIVPSAMFRFTYLAFENSPKYGRDQRDMVRRLKDGGIPMDAVFIASVKAPYTKTQETLCHAMDGADCIYQTEVLKVFGIQPALIHRFDSTRRGLVTALEIQAKTIAAWDFHQFCEWARQASYPTV